MDSGHDCDIALKISVLGPMQVTSGSGVPVPLRSRRARAILGMLALAAPRPVPRRQFMELLWSSRHREQADASLRQCVAELNRALRPIGQGMLITGGGRLALGTDGLWVDAKVLGCATSTRPGALRLLRGPLLDDLEGLDPAFDRWLDAERRRISATASTLAERALKGQTDPAERVAIAHQLLRIDRVSEAGWRALIASYAEQGEYTAAMDAYGQCCAALAELAHRSPSPETEALVKRTSRESSVPAPPPSSATRIGSTRSRKYVTRLGIMPLRGLDRASEEFAEGLVEEITTALGRFRDLACVLLAHVTAAPGDPQAWQALGLDFLLDGSVQSSGGRVRVAVRLLDVHSAGEMVWSQRFDLELTDILTLRDEIASQTVAQVDPALMSREGDYAAAHRPTDATAYHLLLRAIPAIHRLDRVEFLKAGDLLAMAVARDPDYAPVHAWSAYWHLLLLGQGWAKDSGAIEAHLQQLTYRAVSLDPRDARALTLAGHVRAFTLRRLDEAFELHERALSINPHLPLTWLFSGLAHTYSGQHDEAIRRMQQAKKLSPLDPHEFFFEMGLTFSHLLRGDFETAIGLGRRALALNPRFSSTCKSLLSALGYAGDPKERAEVLAHLLALEPGFTMRSALERSPLSLPDDRVLYAEGLRQAGLSE